MFDFLRNLRKSGEEKRQEQLHAYLDDALTPQERQQFEQELAQDAALKAEMDELRLMKQQLRGLPRRPVPHSFTLDPSLYGRPTRQPLFQFYPVLQGATVLTALFFILALSLSLFQPQTDSQSAVAVLQDTTAEQAEAPALEEPAAEAFAFDSAADSAEEEAVVVTRVVTEAVAETVSENITEEVEVEEEALAAEEMAEETAAEEPPMEETANDAESDEGAAAGESLTEATAVPAPAVTTDEAILTPAPTLTAVTATSMPTPTVSELPRSSPTQTADNRGLATQATIAPDDGQTATDTTSSNAVEQQAPSAPTPIPTPLARTPPSPLRLAQIGLGLLLLIFGVLTFYVRRNL